MRSPATKISVGPPFFNLTFGPLMVPLLLAVPFGPLLSWKRGDLLAACQRLYAAFGLAIAMTLITFYAWGMDRVLAPLGVGLAVWVMAGSVSEIVTRVKFFQIGPKRGFARLVGLPGSAWGTAAAHFGIGVTVLGIVTASAFQEERVLTMRPGDTVELAGFQVTFDGAAPRRGPNYTEEVGHFSVRQGGTLVTGLDPSKRVYTARQMPTTEAAIHTSGFSQLYLSLGESRGDGAVDVRVYFKPLITLIWIGCVIMALGAVFSMADRRLRVGAPKPARQTQARSGRGGVGLIMRFFLTRLLICLCVMTAPALAVTPDEILDDPALEARARALSAGLRCMVCQNQSIDDSDAPLAKDLRIVVRERLVAGDSDAEVIDYVVYNYGEFVLLKPRFAWHTLVLWAAGPLALIAGIAAIVITLRRRQTTAAAAGANQPTPKLSAEEEKRLKVLLSSKDQS
jgi:cytochrome c-type biogenesis protein CcmH/NrfF